MHSMRILLVLLPAAAVGLAVAAVLSTWPGSAGATFPGLNGKIAFMSDRDGNREVYVMNADGSEPTRLTDDPEIDGSPAWSRDGTKIAFSSNRTGNSDIYMMNADGTGLTNLTNHEASDSSPSWSPDGTKIAFQRSFNVYVLTIGLSPPQMLASLVNFKIAGDPAWSPDGTRIAFTGLAPFATTKGFRIHVTNADGSGSPVAIGSENRGTGGPSWSPDGSKIAYHTSGLSGGFNFIRVINADGTGNILLATGSSFDSSPSWSPDGTKIAFNSGRDRSEEIFAIDVQSGQETRLTDNDAFDFAPDWQPVGVVGGMAVDLQNGADFASGAEGVGATGQSLSRIAYVSAAAGLAATTFALAAWRVRRGKAI